MHIHPFSRRMLLLLPLALLAWGANTILPTFSSVWIDLFIRSGLIGLVLLVTGVALSQMSLWWLSLSILGFLVMVAGGMWMLRGGGKSTFNLSDGYHSSAGRRRPQKSGGLGDRMEDNFRRRFEN